MVARGAGDRRVRNGVDGCLSAANATGGQSASLVRCRIWDRNHYLRFIESTLVVVVDVVYRRCARQRERNHPRLDRTTGDAG